MKKVPVNFLKKVIFSTALYMTTIENPLKRGYMAML